MPGLLVVLAVLVVLMLGLVFCELERSRSGVARPCRADGADMALRRPAREAGGLSTLRNPRPL